MNNSTYLWLSLTLFCIAIQAIFSMLEMAAVSFNKVRLQYYILKGFKRARWLNYLLEKPSRLFGTTLLGVNAALQIGSECSRKFYETLNISSDFAPITQIFLVVIIAELAPLLAARKYPEHVVMLGIHLIYFCSKILTPMIWVITLISQGANQIFNKHSGSKNKDSFLGREDLKYAIQPETPHIDSHSEKQEAFNLIISNLFVFRSKKAQQVMDPLNTIRMVPSNCTVGHLRKLLSGDNHKYIPVYQQKRSNILGIAYPRDLIKVPDNQLLRNYCQKACLITETTPVVEILQQFRKSDQSIATVLNKKGHAIGILDLNDILEEIFGDRFNLPIPFNKSFISRVCCLDLDLPAKMKIQTFNKRFNTNIKLKNVSTLEDLFREVLEKTPEPEDQIIIENLEFTLLKKDNHNKKIIHIRTIT